YKNANAFLNYNKLYHRIKTEPVYRDLSSDSAQQLLRRLSNNYKSFFSSLNKGIAARPPRFLKKDGLTTVDFIPRQIRCKNGETRLTLGYQGERVFNTKYLYIPFIYLPGKLKLIRIVPKQHGLYFEVHYVYEIDNVDTRQSTSFLGIDLGLNNFATCVATDETAFILEGCGIKSYNRLYNKKLAKLSSEIIRNSSQNKIDKRGKLIYDRNNAMRNMIEKYVNYIVDHCIEHDIGTVIVGEWGDMKRGLRMRKKTSQMFQQIPYAKFKRTLALKCGLMGLNFSLQEESYTSQTCSGCGIIRKANRVHRGLYRCINSKLELNADINASINIIRKVAPKALCGWGSGQISCPARIRILNF
ncbi:MAG: RNA-guided endonuclease InsQ/TnpB family protein, partial [Candidatus Heimdallarchaeota archaeon]